MQDLFLAILSSAAMTIVLKIFRDSRGNRYGLVLGNYLMCVLLSRVMLPDGGMIFRGSAVTLLCGAAAGGLFVAGLLSMQSSIRGNGAALTAAFSKLGLLVSLGASMALFGERPGGAQVLGVLLVLPAVVLINSRGKDGQKEGPGAWHLLALTLLCSGCSDTMAKVFEQVGSRGEDGLYFLYLFLTAAGITAGLAWAEKRRRGLSILPVELFAGAMVGVPNYFSSMLLLRALVRLPVFVVYPVFSTGTILLVLAVSALCFGEKPGKRQLAGIGLILGALVLLNL